MPTPITALRRSLRRALDQPAGSLVVVLTLAVALGAVTSLFDLINLIQWQPLPGTRSQPLVRIYTAHPQPFIGPYGGQPQEDYEAYRDGATQLAAVVGERLEVLTGRLPDGSERSMQVQFVPGDYFEVLGLNPATGRLLQSSDDQEEPLVVISHGLWTRALGGDWNPGVSSLGLGQFDLPIVGVAPEGFTSLAGDEVEAWVTLRHGPAMVPGFEDPGGRNTGILALLAPGSSTRKAQAELQNLAQELDRLQPLRDVPREISVIRAGMSHPIDQRNFRPILRMLTLGAGLLLLLAASNVASIQLARTLRLAPQLAVQRALGAQPRRLVAQQLADASLLVLAGAALAVPLAILARRLFTLWDLESFAAQMRVDHRVLAATLVVGLLTTLFVSVAPTLFALGTRPAGALRSGGREIGRQRTFQLLATTQIVLSTALLLLTAVVFLDLRALAGSDLGFDGRGLLHAYISGGELGLDGAQTSELAQRVETELVAHPEVDGVGRSLFVPPIFLDVGREYRLPGRDETHQARMNFVEPSYFETLGLERLEGRWFTPSGLRTEATRREILVNQMLARSLWPDGSAIGRQLEILGRSQEGVDLHEVVGVVETIAQRDLKSGGEPIVYFPLDNYTRPYTSLVIRLTESGLADSDRIASVREALERFHVGLGKIQIRTSGQVRHDSMVVERLRSQTIGLLGLLGLLLTAVGIWGVMHLHVTRRRREWALRTALGATPFEVTARALRQAVVLLAVGSVGGLVSSIVVLRFARSEFGDLAAPPWIWLGAFLTICGCGLTSALAPARRAPRAEPATELRE